MTRRARWGRTRTARNRNHGSETVREPDVWDRSWDEIRNVLLSRDSDPGATGAIVHALAEAGLLAGDEPEWEYGCALSGETPNGAHDHRWSDDTHRRRAAGPWEPLS